MNFGFWMAECRFARNWILDCAAARSRKRSIKTIWSGSSPIENPKSKIENSTMSLQRDYILRLVEQLREFLAQITRLREGARPDDALIAIAHAQEQLFARPIAQFGALLPDAQFHMLIHGERPEQARAKILLQADLLAETARVYDAKDQLALAQGARHYALELLQLAAAQFPAPVLDAPIAALHREIATARPR